MRCHINGRRLVDVPLNPHRAVAFNRVLISLMCSDLVIVDLFQLRGRKRGRRWLRRCSRSPTIDPVLSKSYPLDAWAPKLAELGGGIGQTRAVCVGMHIEREIAVNQIYLACAHVVVYDPAFKLVSRNSGIRGHSKSLKTSMVIGAFFEPIAFTLQRSGRSHCLCRRIRGCSVQQVPDTLSIGSRGSQEREKSQSG